MENTIVTVDKDCQTAPKSFREKLALIQKQAQEDRKGSIMYKNIKERIQGYCERAAYESKNCLYIEDLHLSDFIVHTRYSLLTYNDGLDKTINMMISSICDELDLEFDGQYIMWGNK